MKILLLLLYIWAGDVKLEQVPAASIETCEVAILARVEALIKEPKFNGGLFADCIQLSVVEVKAK